MVFQTSYRQPMRLDVAAPSAPMAAAARREAGLFLSINLAPTPTTLNAA